MSKKMTAEAIVAEHYAAGAASDFAGMVKHFSPNIEWVESDGGAYAGTYFGLDSVITNIFSRINEEWDGFAAIPEVLIADETKGIVAALCTYVGTFRATSKPQCVRVIHVWTVADDQIIKFEQVCDTAEQFKAMK